MTILYRNRMNKQSQKNNESSIDVQPYRSATDIFANPPVLDLKSDKIADHPKR